MDEVSDVVVDEGAPDGGASGDVAQTVAEHVATYPTSAEIASAVAEQVAPMIAESDAAVISSLTGQVSEGRTVALIGTDDALAYLPPDAPAYVGSYLTPAVWGVAAGLVAFLIGYVWEAFARLLGLAGRK